MSTVLRIGPYRFYIYSADRAEPAHVHVKRDDAEAKFWLMPVRLARNDGFRTHELRNLKKVVEKHQQDLLEAWNESFDL
ncbi:MAG: DUF4160 domain-containing protein [Pirellulaceae bacterium]|nr:DUF4160 domain-containing protein [Pirellulaceae bacterium]